MGFRIRPMRPRKMTETERTRAFWSISEREAVTPEQRAREDRALALIKSHSDSVRPMNVAVQHQSETCRVTLDFEIDRARTIALAGTLTQETPKLFFLDLDRGHEPHLSRGDAWEAVRLAIVDRRIHVPDAFRVALDNGAKIL